MIQVNSLVKRYSGNTVLDNLSFTIGDRGIHGLLGTNGAGKSTTMNILTGCIPATSGSVLIDGHDIATEPTEVKRRIGYLPEHPPLYPDMTPYEYLVFVAEAKKVSYDRLYRQVEEAMELTGIDGVRSRLIRNLSKGYLQRIGIAQTLLGNPDIIILDEPTSGLDPKQLTEIRGLIKMLGKIKTVIISSHILAEISEICDDVIIIAHGKLVANDTIANLENRMNASRSIRLSVRGKEEEVLPALGHINGITGIETLDQKHEGVLEIRIGHRSNIEVRDFIFSSLAEIHAPILSMENESASLEDVFLALTKEPEKPDPEQEPAKKSLFGRKGKEDKD